MNNDIKIIVRGAGDIASGIIWTLAYAGFKVICTDIEKPSCIRREVSFSEAIYDGEKTIENITCKYVGKSSESDIADKIENALDENKIALIIDENMEILKKIEPYVVVDSILAKKNLGTTIDMAKLVIGVGPGFTAKVDCHYAIETMRGHKLATIYENGSPIPNTGIPGLIASHGADRVMHSECEGVFHNIKKISDIVKKGDVLSNIEEYKDGGKTGSVVPLTASIDGVLRGILRDGFYAKEGLKCADIDPRISEKENCFTISDKARAIGGAVLLAVVRSMK